MEALKSKIPWEFHFKALIQAKGFLKIIQFVSFFLVASCDVRRCLIMLCYVKPMLVGQVNFLFLIHRPHAFSGSGAIKSTMY